MTVTPDIAHDQAAATRERVERVVGGLPGRIRPGALASEAKAWAKSCVEATQEMAMEVSDQTATLVKENPLKAAAIGAALAAAGLAIGFFATRGRL